MWDGGAGIPEMFSCAFADIFQLSPAEHCCDSKTYFIPICIRQRAQQVVRNPGGWEYCTSLNRQKCIDFLTMQHLSTAPFNTFSPVVTISGILAGKITREIVSRKLLKYYFNNTWLSELYSVVYAQEYFGYFGGLLSVMPVIEHLPLLPMRSHEQRCWWQWGSHRMGRSKGIAIGDRKDNIFQNLFVEGWSTSERRNNFRETKI